jgi:hypothetical protein
LELIPGLLKCLKIPSQFLRIPTLQMLSWSICPAAVGAARRRGRKTAADNSRPRRSCLPAARPGGPDDWNLAEVLGTIMGQNLLSHAIPLQYHEPLSMLQRWGGGGGDRHGSEAVPVLTRHRTFFFFFPDRCAAKFRLSLLNLVVEPVPFFTNL